MRQARLIYPEANAGRTVSPKIDEVLRKQNIILSGAESKKYKYVPKVLCLCLNRLGELKRDGESQVESFLEAGRDEKLLFRVKGAIEEDRWDVFEILTIEESCIVICDFLTNLQNHSKNKLSKGQIGLACFGMLLSKHFANSECTAKITNLISHTTLIDVDDESSITKTVLELDNKFI